MINLVLFLSFFISSIMGFFIANYFVIPILDFYFRKNENIFLKNIYKIKKENEKMIEEILRDEEILKEIIKNIKEK